MILGVPKESFPGETRVALIPDSVAALAKKEISVIIEAGAGLISGFPDAEYQEKGATIASSRSDVFAKADVIVQVRALGANPVEGKADLSLMKKGQVVIGCMEPLTEFDSDKALADAGVTSFSMELIPRITRAQSMDILSSMATIAGYKAVMIATDNLPRMFPMMMTAAGTIKPARVFVIGAGVAGLQAIASAKKNGAIVHAYDLRPAVKEQVESLGGKFVEMELEASTSEDKGGYAKEMDEAFYKKQRELMTKVVAENDVVITTAAIPGKKSPILVTKEMVEGMHTGSMIVDLAAERGGNCELTKAGEVVEHNGVSIHGPLNIPSSIPYHASQMYAKNIITFFFNMFKDGQIDYNMEDEIVKETLVTKDGTIVNERVIELMNK